MIQVLIVCSGNVENFIFEIHQAFINEQIRAVGEKYPQVKFSIFLIKGKGWLGYLSNYKQFCRTIRGTNYDLIHAHFSLSSLLANLQRKVPVVTTFHGSDINVFSNNIISSLVNLSSSHSIFVSEELRGKIILKKRENKSSVIPCGIDLGDFYPVDKQVARKKMNLSETKKYILFSSSFSSKVKNYPLAYKAITILKDNNIELLELKNLQRDEVNLLLNASDVALLTSFSEGSPQFIKEAMACNCPIVSTNVGDIREITKGTDGCYITTFDPIDVAEKINKAIKFSNRTTGRNSVLNLDNKRISDDIYNIYLRILNKIT
jgi:teichuronic acid biosynthesis glycosyltransferase TuaC